MSRTQFIVVSGKRETDDIARKIVEECVPFRHALLNGE